MDTSRDTVKPRAKGGFTLLEVTVSTGILVLLVLLLTQMFSQVSRAWIQGESGNQRLQNVRAIADYIGADLQAALLPVNKTSVTDLQLVVNPRNLTGEFFNRDAVFWQAPIATDRTRGDVAEVGYFVKWDESVPGNPRAMLCRFFVNPTDTANYAIHTRPDEWITEEILNAVAPGTASPGDPSNSFRGLLAENVVGLWVQCLDSAGNPISATDGFFDSRAGYTDAALGPRPASALPAMIKLSLVLLDGHGAGRVGSAQQTAIRGRVASSADGEAFVAGALSDSQLSSLRQSFRSYTTKVYLQNAY